MTGKDVYERAITSLGYTDSQVFKNKAVVAINQIYDLLHPLAGQGEYRPLSSLGDVVNLTDRAASGALVYGVAERLALGEADGELQQYFAKQFDRARARLNAVDRIVDTMPQ